MKFLKRTGFTLLEMLVVIAIIALLAGIMVPGINKARQAAMKSDIRAEVMQLKAAWEMSYVELKILPPDGWTNMSQAACHYLHGTNDADLAYMEFSTNVLYGASTNGMRDKYLGKIYRIALDNGTPESDGSDDGGYDGIVKYYGRDISTHVAVWHDWKKADDESDDIKSWKDL